MKIICIERNYVDHISKLNRQAGGGTERPAESVWFLKSDPALLKLTMEK